VNTIVPLTTGFSTMTSGDFVQQAEFCYFFKDISNLSSLMPISSIHVFGWEKKAPWNPSLLDIGHGADRCDAFGCRSLLMQAPEVISEMDI
jgi:hypothetical protein